MCKAVGLPVFRVSRGVGGSGELIGFLGGRGTSLYLAFVCVAVVLGAYTGAWARKNRIRRRRVR